MRLLSLLLFSFPFLTNIVLFAQTNAVSVPVQVSDGTVSQTLYIGLNPSATNGVDIALEEVEQPPVPPSGIFDARLIGTDIGLDFGQGLLKDYRNGNETTSGIFVYELKHQPGTGKVANISWTLPEHVYGLLQDLITGSVISIQMNGSGSYPDSSNLGKFKITLHYNYLAAPTVLTASSTISSKTNLQWLDNSIGEAGFKIERKEFHEAAFTEVGTAPANAKIFEDNTVADTTRYIYRVRAFDGNLYSGYSNETETETVLPVEMGAFNAKASGDIVLLTWFTITETNNSRFEIERMKNITGNWTKVGFRDGSISSVEKKIYSFTDVVNEGAGKYSYRLKQIDLNGSFTYSKVVDVEYNPLVESFKLSQNFPNPFNPATIIKFENPVEAFAKLKVYNSAGEEIRMLLNNKISSGVHQIEFDASDLISGSYFVMFEAVGEDGRYFSDSIKMMLLK